MAFFMVTFKSNWRNGERALGMFVAERHERITIFISGTRQNA